MSNGNGKGLGWIAGVLIPLFVLLLGAAIVDRQTLGANVEANEDAIIEMRARMATKADLHDAERVIIRCINAHQRGEVCDL